jgi:hypothetical protein
MSRLRTRSLVIAVVLALVASACTSHAKAGTGAHQTSSVAVPDPGAGPDAAALPAAAPKPSGSPQDQALALAKQVKAGGKSAEAALRTALTLGGITLTEVDGTVVAKGAAPSLGVSIPIGQIMFVADQNTYEHGLSAGQVASTIDAVWSDKIDATKLRDALLDDLRAQAAGTKPSDASTQAFLSSFIIDVGMQATPPSDIAAATGSDVELTGMQNWLLWLSLAGGAYTNAVAAAHAKGTAYVFTGAHAALAADNPCSAFNGAIGDAGANAAGAVTGGVPLTGWDGVSSLIPESNPGKSMGLGEWLGVANAALSLVHLLVEGLALNGKYSVNPSPVERTKGIAPAVGANATVKLTLFYKLPMGQYANCLRGVLNASGLDFSLPNDGPIKDAEVGWDLDNSPGLDNNPLQYYSLNGESATTTHTDSDGVTQTGIQGRWQKSPVPKDVKPFMETVTLRAGVQIKPNEILGTLNDAISAVLGGVAAPVIIAVNMIERSKILTEVMTVQVKDWPLDFMVDADMDQDNGNGNHPHISGVKCNGVAGEWKLNINGAPGLDFTLDANGKGTTHGDFGTVNVTLIQGDPAKLQFSISGAYYQTVTVTAGQFCDHPF